MLSLSVDLPVDGTSTSKRDPKCSDPSILPSTSAPRSVKDLWYLHGHPHSNRYSDPKLISLAALVRHDGKSYGNQPGFLYPVPKEPQMSYQSLSWDEFDRLTESLAALYAHELLWELQQANRTRQQPTVALLGRGTTIEYFCTEIALQKLGVRVLLLAESNSVAAIHHLLGSCDVLAVITDTTNAGADIKHTRKIMMIEDLPRNVTVQQANVDEIKFQDSGDVWERHTFILHSSGSTGMPKLIVHTNRSLMLIARMYRLFPDFEIINWFLLFPLYHIAGLSIALSGLPNGRLLSFPPLLWPPSSSALLTSWEKLSEMGFPVDVVHCAPTLIENMCDYITESGRSFKPLSSLKVLQPGGAALSTDIINLLVANGVNVKSTYGSTEIGPPFRTIPHTRDNPKCYSFRSLYPDNSNLKMEKVGEGLYECVVYKGFELAAELWDKTDEPYRTKDLFTQEPPGSGFYVLQGRTDDILIHTNGENTSGGSLQLDIQSSSKAIKKALALGHSRPCISLLVELNDDYDPQDEKTEEIVWNTVEEINERYPSHSRVLRSMVYLLPKGKNLPVTPKGNVRRKEAEEIFGDEIKTLYKAFEGNNHFSGTVDPEQPLDEYIRNIFANVAGAPIDAVKDRTTIYDLGIDSRLALTLRSLLSKGIGPISLGAIFENPSPLKILRFFRNKNKASSTVKLDQSQLTSHLLAKLTSEFQTWPIRSQCLSPITPATETILLTGSTGTLGTSLLKMFSSSPRVSKIYALIRGPNHAAKLRDSLSSRGHDADAILGTGKIEILNYSMQDPLLGLTIEDYAKLAGTVTILLHNAWKMDFNLGVQSFVDDCLRGTLSLLRLAHSGAPKTFAFISSSAASTFSASPNTGHNTGYALSKHLCEALLSSFSAHHFLPIVILRSGQLCGHSVTGSWNTTELWPILFKTGLALEALPVFDKDSSFSTVDWLPVDTAAAVIGDILLDNRLEGVEEKFSTQDAGSAATRKGYRAFDIVHPAPIAWDAMLRMLQTHLPASHPTLSPMREVPLATFVSLLNGASEAGASVDALPGLKLLPFFERLVGEADGRSGNEKRGGNESGSWNGVEGAVVFDVGPTMKISPSLRACKPLGAANIDRSVGWWRANRFLA